MSKQILTRDGIPTEELSEIKSTTIQGVDIEYNEVYYLDYEVDESTGMINRDLLVKHYTADQMDRNIKTCGTVIIEKIISQGYIRTFLNQNNGKN